MSDEPELRIVTFSTIWDSTPEGMYRMDRLHERARQEREEFRAKWGDEALRLADKSADDFERKVLGI